MPIKIRKMATAISDGTNVVANNKMESPTQATEIAFFRPKRSFN